jgi:D-erythronate 2-dehydrogenase
MMDCRVRLGNGGGNDSMHVLITGAAGMIGRKLTRRLVEQGGLNGRAIEKLTLVDVISPTRPAGFTGRVTARAADLSDPKETARAISGRPDVIFHLASIVSGEAETNFDKGYQINLIGMLGLIEAIRRTGDGYRPKFVFTSSIAVFGAPFPESIPDDFHLTPLTSYGTQKAICELLLADYTRKGFLEGVGIRLPTICVRPGRPNAAASGFFSSIIREPLAGMEAVLPVAESVRHAHASPRSAVGFLVHAAELSKDELGPRNSLTMPGTSCTVGEQIEALRRVAGDRVAARIRREPDPMIMRIVSGWAQRVDAKRARALGFKAEESFDAIIRAHIEDELEGRIAA